MRILNGEVLGGHGNREGRRRMLQILEAGLAAADPYVHTKRLLTRRGNKLLIGHPDYEADGDPQAGKEELDLTSLGRIYIVGAGKGIQRVVKALEEILGDFLAGGEIICKYGDPLLVERVHVTFGSHPLPDEGCVAGARRILSLAQNIDENDLVFTVIANGASSLLTLPFEGISLEDVRQVVHTVQIAKGIGTLELNAVRNHIDRLKGGRMTRLFSRARMIHLVVADANRHINQVPPADFPYLMRHNVWLHNLPESSTFKDAVDVLKRHRAWKECPESIRTCLLRADPSQETVKWEEYAQTRFRVFGLMPGKEHFLLKARECAAEMGYHDVLVTDAAHGEAAQLGCFVGAVACNIARHGEPLPPPVALFMTGEMVVTVADRHGIGGRNQEFALATTSTISGCDNVVVASVDTDGTDGPGGFGPAGNAGCLAGGIVDGYTSGEAARKGVDLARGLMEHDTSGVLWETGCGVLMEQGVSLNDLTVVLVDHIVHAP